jgi:CBS domain-containing protein
MSPRAAWRLESLGFTKVFDYAPGKLDWVSVGLPVEGTKANEPNLGRLSRRDSPTCKLDERISDVKARLQGDPTSPCVVVNDHRIVLGLLRSDAIQANGSKTVEDAMLKGPVTFRPNAALEEVDRYLTDHHLGYALVTTSDGELIGLAGSDDIRRRLAESKAG